MEFLKSAAEYASTQYSDMPRPSTRNIHKNENAIIRMLEMEERMTTAQDKINEVTAVIDKVTEPTQQAILVKRYLSNKTWVEISSELHYSIPHIYEVHRYALEVVQVILNDHSKS